MTNQLITVDSNFMRRAAADRELLLEACKFAVDWVNTFLPHQGPAENNLLEKLQTAIAAIESKEQAA